MIIGIGGEKQHGKDTVANYLVKEYEYTRMAFADNLKRLCSSIFPEVDFYDEANKETPFEYPIKVRPKDVSHLIDQLDYRLTEDQINVMYSMWMSKAYFHSVRDILQYVGTNILRNIVDEDYHYNTVANPFKLIERGVVSDVRFKNERVNLERDFDCRTILVVRPSMKKNSTSNHASENSLGDRSEYDYVIINDGTLEDLYAKVDAIMEELNPLKVSGA